MLAWGKFAFKMCVFIVDKIVKFLKSELIVKRSGSFFKI